MTRTLQHLGAWILGLAILAGIPAIAAVTPSINKIADINAGSVIPGASAGTLVLDSNAYPGGNRRATGGTLLGGSPSFTLGALTLTGRPGATWSISRNGNFAPLTGPGGSTIAVNSVDFEPSATNSGTFPASSASTSTTGTYYLGVELAVGTAARTPAGLYTGSFFLVVNDTSSGLSGSLSFTITVKVDPTPITLTQLSSLRFGDLFSGASAGTLVLNTTGARTVTGGVLLGNLSASGPASFTVTGSKNATYAITLPTSVTLTGPGGVLTVSPFTSSPSTLGLLSGTGQQQLYVGGRLNVAANQADGDYQGTFAVTVAYN